MIEKEAEESKESPVESETSVCGRLYNIIMRAMLQEIHIYVETQSCLTVFIPYDNVPQNDLSKNVSHKNKRVGMNDSLKNCGLYSSSIFGNRYFKLQLLPPIRLKGDLPVRRLLRSLDLIAEQFVCIGAVLRYHVRFIQPHDRIGGTVMLGNDGRGEVAGDLQGFFELFFEMFDREQCFRIDGKFCFGHDDLPFVI